MTSERDAQFTVDATADGGWEVVLLLGSNFIERRNFDTLDEALAAVPGMLAAALPTSQRSFPARRPARENEQMSTVALFSGGPADTTLREIEGRPLFYEFQVMERPRADEPTSAREWDAYVQTGTVRYRRTDETVEGATVYRWEG